MTGEFDGCILSFLLRLYTLVFFDTFFFASHMYCNIKAFIPFLFLFYFSRRHLGEHGLSGYTKVLGREERSVSASGPEEES